MKVIKNPISDDWELAESNGAMPQSAAGGLPCFRNRILIVDDEEQTLKLYATSIQTAFPGMECDQARNGARAVELFMTRHPLVIVMDIVMPVLDGEEAYYQIEEHCQTHNWQPPRVIFCTGHSPSVGLRNVVAGDPAHCLLRKPIRKRILLTALSKRLGLRPISSL